MAFFPVQCLLVLDITLSLPSFAEPQYCQHQRTFITWLGWTVPLHPDLWGTSWTHREGKRMYIRINVGIHIYTHTHTPPAKHTYTHPYLCSHCWHKTTCSSPIRITTASLAAQSSARKETGWWIWAALAAQHHPMAIAYRWWQIHLGKKGLALTFLIYTEKRETFDLVFSYLHMNIQTIWALIKFGLEHGTVSTVKILFWISREPSGWSAPL